MRGQPFSRHMNVTGAGAGADPTLKYAVAVEKKIQDTVREQGQQAIKLIDAATTQGPDGTGKRLNLVA
jgi:hypothetical protein